LQIRKARFRILLLQKDGKTLRMVSSLSFSLLGCPGQNVSGANQCCEPEVAAEAPRAFQGDSEGDQRRSRRNSEGDSGSCYGLRKLWSIWVRNRGVARRLHATAEGEVAVHQVSSDVGYQGT
jgi:hypothetical protein